MQKTASAIIDGLAKVAESAERPLVKLARRYLPDDDLMKLCKACKKSRKKKKG